MALDGITLGLGDIFLVVVGCCCCGFFGSAPCSDKVESGFVLEGLVRVVAGIVGFLLLSVSAIAFLELL